MEFKDLEIFQMIAQKGTITEVAKELNYVQSNITSRLHKLEAELNSTLFNRHNRGMSLTPEGKKLLIYCEKILFLKNEMEKALENSEEPSGKLDVGYVDSVSALTNILFLYTKKYKHIDVSLVTGVTEKLQEDVLNRQLDGAFVMDIGSHPDLVSYTVLEEELVIISSAKNETSIEQLMKEPILCFSKGCAYRERLKTWYKDQNKKPYKIMEFGTLEMLLTSVISDIGISIVPRSSVSHLEKMGLIRVSSLPEKYSKMNTIFIRRADTYLTPTIKKFIETIEQCKENMTELQVN